MLELLAHKLLDFEHVVSVALVTLDFVDFLNINFISFHNHQLFNVGASVRRQNVRSRILDSHPHFLSFKLFFNRVVDRVLKTLSKVADPVDLLLHLRLDPIDEFPSCLYLVSQLFGGFLFNFFKLMSRSFLNKHLVIPPYDLVMVVEIYMELVVVRVVFVHPIIQEIPHFLKFLHFGKTIHSCSQILVFFHANLLIQISVQTQDELI